MKSSKSIAVVVLFVGLICAANWLPKNEESTEAAISAREDARDAALFKLVAR